MLVTADKGMADFPEDVVAEGSAIVEEFLQTWATSTSSREGDDVIMADAMDPDQQLEELKRCVAQFQSKFEHNPWVLSILSSL